MRFTVDPQGLDTAAQRIAAAPGALADIAASMDRIADSAPLWAEAELLSVVLRLTDAVRWAATDGADAAAGVQERLTAAALTYRASETAIP